MGPRKVCSRPKAGPHDRQLSGGSAQLQTEVVRGIRQRAHSRCSCQGRADIQFSLEKQEADVVLGHTSSMGVRLQGLEKGLVKEGRNFDGELLQECITIESLRVCGDVTVVAGNGHAGRIHEGEVPGVVHTMQVRCG